MSARQVEKAGLGVLHDAVIPLSRYTEKYMHDIVYTDQCSFVLICVFEQSC